MNYRLSMTTVFLSSVGMIGLMGASLVSAQEHSTASIAAVAGQQGGQDITGPYDVVADWPKDIS
mgnify:FL=1